MSEEHLVLRGLDAFEGDSLPPRMAALGSKFSAAWHRLTSVGGDRATLADVLWATNNPQLERWLVARIVAIAEVERQAWAEIREAVTLGEASRLEGLFVLHGGPLPASSTFAAHMAGIQEGIERVDEPLPAVHTAKLRERYRARRGLG